MSFVFRMESGRVIAELDNIRQSQLNFAISKAINDVGYGSQEAIRKGMDQDLNMHSQSAKYERNRIMVIKRAKADSLSLVIQVDPKAMNLVRLVNNMEHDGWFPFNGRLYLWTPNSEVFRGRIITTANPLHPKNLEFGYGAGPRPGGVSGEFKGNQRTFAISPKEGKNRDIPQIWQRVGSSAPAAKQKRHKGIKESKNERMKNTRLLYVLLSKRKTPAKLRFYEPVQKTIHETWAEAMHAALELAVIPRAMRGK